MNESWMYPVTAFPTKRTAVTGMGLAVLDRIYTGDHDSPLEALGGSCGNVLVSLAMLGHCVTPIIALGDDKPGDFLLREFRRSGCATDLVYRKADRGSPVIVEYVDPVQARHWFSFTCPKTLMAFPRWCPVDEEQVRSARGILEDVSVFYADRLSPSIVGAMETARSAGALVFFEPANRGDETLLAKALRTATVLKLSDETAGTEIASGEIATLTSAAVIRTHGAHGLTASFAGSERFFPPPTAPRLLDTCGAGDMVTVGLIDYLLQHSSGRGDCPAEDFFTGIKAGQKLAALNCAFAGARGVFHALGATNVRSGLDNGFGDGFVAHAMTFGPYDGY